MQSCVDESVKVFFFHVWKLNRPFDRGHGNIIIASRYNWFVHSARGSHWFLLCLKMGMLTMLTAWEGPDLLTVINTKYSNARTKRNNICCPRGQSKDDGDYIYIYIYIYREREREREASRRIKLQTSATMQHTVPKNIIKTNSL